MLAIFVGVVVWFARQIHDFVIPPSTAVTVPSFVGQTLTDANAEVGRLKLSSAVVDHTTSDRYPKGVVIMQRPVAGTGARRPADFFRRERRHRQPADARLALSVVTRSAARTSRASGCEASRITVCKKRYRPRRARDLAKSAAFIQASTTAIRSISSLAAARCAVLQVPHFTGLTIDGARDLAGRSGVKLGQIVWTPLGPSGPPHGAVVRQVPAPDSKIASFEPVSLQVSAGPFESGYVIRQVRLLVSVPGAEH